MRRRALIPVVVFAAGSLTVAAAALRPGPPPPARNPDVHGEWVKYTGVGGDTVMAYIAYPERPDAAPGVVVIHEIFGLSDWVRGVADSLAVRGFVAITPDLLTRRGGTERLEQPRRAIRDLPSDSVQVDLDATYAYLQSLPAVRRDAIAVIGFCWGGGRSFLYASHNPGLRAAVVCYGSAPDAAAMARIHAPVFGVYGENDARITATVPETERMMRDAGKRYRTQVYAGTGHGFLRTRQPESSAAEAWRDVVAFLQSELEAGSRNQN